MSCSVGSVLLCGKCFGFWEVFLDSGKCIGFWKVFLDSGKCFWILGSALNSGKCFGFWEVFCPYGPPYKSKTMSELCRKHQIKQVHGAPPTPSNQRLVERNNDTVKENILNILKERDESLGKWCTVNAFVHLAMT